MNKYIVIGVICALIIALNIPLIEKCQIHYNLSSKYEEIYNKLDKYGPLWDSGAKEIEIGEGTFANPLYGKPMAFYNGSGWELRRSSLYEIECGWCIHTRVIRTFTGKVELVIAEFICERKYPATYYMRVKFYNKDDLKEWSSWKTDMFYTYSSNERIECKKYSILQYIYHNIKKALIKE